MSIEARYKDLSNRCIAFQPLCNYACEGCSINPGSYIRAIETEVDLYYMEVEAAEQAIAEARNNSAVMPDPEPLGWDGAV